MNNLIQRINVGDSLTRTAALRPTQLAVVDGERRWPTLFRPEHQLSHLGAVGTPITGVQVGIMGPTGELLPPGEQGEIVYRGPSTMKAVYAADRRIAEVVVVGLSHPLTHIGARMLFPTPFPPPVGSEVRGG